MMAGTTTGTTTESRTALRPASGLPVRFRIALAIGLLVAVALTGAGLIMMLIGEARIDENIRDDAAQEMAEFTEFQRTGLDPDTGAEFRSLERLLRVYLERNVPAASELMLGYWDDGLRVASASDRQGLLRDPDFVSAVDRSVRTSTGSQVVTTGWGEVYFDVLPLRDRDDAGAFVVAFFVDGEKRDLDELLRTYAVAAVMALGLVTALAAWQAGRLLTPVRTLRETAEEISETDLSRRLPVTGNDDLTDLTRTFNAMLSRLDQAFQGQRAFLDDAGHELRTPLTILRGHLELVDENDPGEVSATRELLLDEVDRMSRLVDDLILLTKADRPGFVTPSAVDLGELVERVTGKVRGLGDRHWTVDAAPRTPVWVDEQRITQALAQLAQNAVKHTDGDDEIGLGAVVENGWAELWVRDTGVGVPDEQKERIFDRFVRLHDDARGDDAGFGLGLSIVSAIAEAHGGSVRVEDATPHGARFVVRVPATERKG